MIICCVFCFPDPAQRLYIQCLLLSQYRLYNTDTIIFFIYSLKLEKLVLCNFTAPGSVRWRLSLTKLAFIILTPHPTQQ